MRKAASGRTQEETGTRQRIRGAVTWGATAGIHMAWYRCLPRNMPCQIHLLFMACANLLVEEEKSSVTREREQITADSRRVVYYCTAQAHGAWGMVQENGGMGANDQTGNRHRHEHKYGQRYGHKAIDKTTRTGMGTDRQRWAHGCDQRDGVYGHNTNVVLSHAPRHGQGHGRNRNECHRHALGVVMGACKSTNMNINSWYILTAG